MRMNSNVVERLIEECHSAKTRAYSPYSKVRVGAALLCEDGTEDGTIIQGCNVENAVYSLSWCAERSAIVAAVSRGFRKFKAIAVTSDMIEKPITPCGACRQVMAEFGTDYDVYMVKPDSTYTKVTVQDLLPYSFLPDDLPLARMKDE